ncbi:glycosyltransferase [Aliivibrio finisterrensis]|uniref:glycosyltransferase n=1 Tax=Aliivibrio finisterrensis TaxID=511998 RepID=UPI00101EB9DF|nr:glycosyltransferase [Aliivibrio finisterrensis]RYU65231.1 glycosyltransferase [Aliivibrio finisterrensis]RYU68605.1 glycosyltransferase [Aliivibrio finisterrensis]RYU72004.1 glycosyltransferase [Aliivibrio finisterrensis]
MKVLHVINNLSIGGAETMLSAIVHTMNKRKGIKVEVLTLARVSSHLVDDIERNGVKVHNLGMKNRLFSFFYILRLVKIMNRFDIVHSHLFPANYMVSIASVLSCGNRIVTTEHSTHNSRRGFKALRPLEMFIYSRYDAIIAISDGTKEALATWLKKNHKINVVPNGIDLVPFFSARERFKSNRDDFFNIIAVGSFSHAKDQDSIIRALTRLPASVSLTLVGDGPRQDELRALVNTLNLNDRVDFLGLRNDIPDLICMSDVLVQSSHWEGFGLTVVEGMAGGIPVIGSDVPGLREVISDSGFLFTQSAELAEQIFKLSTNKELYSEMVSRGLRHVQQFDIERLVDDYLTLYRNVS